MNKGSKRFRFVGKTYDSFTNGKEYQAEFDSVKGWTILEDDEGDPHGIAYTDLLRNFLDLDNRPEPISFTGASSGKLKKACREYIDFWDNDEEYHEDGQDDYQQRIFEAAMKAVYGDKVFDWINARRE